MSTVRGNYNNSPPDSLLSRASIAISGNYLTEFTGVPHSKSANLLEFRHGAFTTFEYS